MPVFWDAIVVGGGPAGALAAYHLARGGAKVALLEAEAIPRHKTCGGGVVGRALPDLPIDVQEVARFNCERAELHVVDAEWSCVIERGHPIVVMTYRSEFDAALVSAAQKAGAHIVTQNRVRSIRHMDDGIEVGTESETYVARIVIAADGAAGTMRRLAGWRDSLPRVPAIEWEAVGKSSEPSAEEGAARFFFGLGGQGYAWIFPKNGSVSIGALSTEGDATALRAQLQQIAGIAGVREVDTFRQDAFVIPTQDPFQPVARGGVLLTGDAAGLADPITWEGISHACTSGRLAAAAALAQGFRREEVSDCYAADLERTVLREIRWARRLARLVYGPDALRRRLFRRCGRALCETMTDIVEGRASYCELARTPSLYGRLTLAALRPARASKPPS